ncbi:pullulanase-type alpha-1,6-glucosidase [Succinimonas sp.]|uniref:pullulanase-type alpha-1,6-glucosidase n=1 Tax=Succinimonas sp. TaxID=1936151 RepID=UPI003867EE20
MSFNIKKLAFLTMPGVVMLSLAACGGSSSSNNDHFNPEASSQVDVQEGPAVSPGGLPAPASELEPVKDKLVVQIMDETLGQALNSRGINDSELLTAHFWSDHPKCDPNDANVGDHVWSDIGVSSQPARVNEYGPVFEFALSDATKDGCSGFILRKGDDPDSFVKVYDGDQVLKWTADDHEISITTRNEESVMSREEAFNQMYGSSGEFDATDASAHWVAPDIIAWKNGDDSLHTRLQYADGIVAPEAGVLNGSFVNLEKTELPASVVEKNHNLEGYQAYQIPSDANLDLKKVLKGEAVLVALDGENKVKKASRIQTAMLIDELYADKATQVNDLGVSATSAGTTFKLWAPTAQDVKLHFWPKAGQGVWDEVPNIVMDFDEETGVWSYTSDVSFEPGDAAYKYELSVYHPSTRKIEDLWVTDPYSLSLFSGNSAIVDLNADAAKPEGWDNLKAPHSQATASDISSMVITESHLRDLTVGSDKGVKNQGKYIGLAEEDTAIANHLKMMGEYGVTHMELLPMYDIASINADDVLNNKATDEDLTGIEFCARAGVESTEGVNVCGDTRPVYDILAETAANDSADEAKVSTFLDKHVKDTDSFNWGYDPVHYQVPEGSYATSIADPYVRIKEIREMIAAIKNNYGMNVILDVVYNHTDGAGVEKDSSVLDKIVPWYYNRLNPETGNVLADTCCSDSASEHRMFAKLMEDTLVTWAKDYKIDAFRFDLMGYLPKQVMVDTLANVRTRSGNKEIYFFGEGWDAGSAAAVMGGENNATQINMHDTEIGTFNDRIRDAVRGSGPFDHGDALIKLQGFATGRCTEMNDKRLALDSGYSCAPDATNESDYGMHPLNWQDVIRISMAGNLRDYELMTYTDEVKLGKDISYWGAIAGYGDSPVNTINYVSKHDNQAIFDLIMYKAKKTNTMENKAKMQGIAVASVMFGQSPVFDQQGTDLLRTKYFQNDSYNTGDFSNKVNYSFDKGNEFIPGALVNKSKDEADWDAILEVSEYNSDVGPDLKASMAKTYLAMTEIRKDHNLFYLGDPELIKKHVSFLNVGSKQIPGLIVMKITKPEGYESQDKEILVMLNAAPEARSFNVPDIEGARHVFTGPLYDGACSAGDGKINAEPWSVCVFVKPELQ